MPAKNGRCENCGLAHGGAVDREKVTSPASELSVTLGLGTMDLMHDAWVIRSKCIHDNHKKLQATDGILCSRIIYCTQK